MSDRITISKVARKQSLYASVIRACRKCGAPGYWHNIPDVNPGCFAPEKVTQLGSDPVGAVCPQCGKPRNDIEPHGEIWRREWRVSFWSLIKETMRDFFSRERKLQ